MMPRMPLNQPESADQGWYVYLIECTDGSLYAGITTDVERRFAQHLAGKGARYTRSHRPLRVVASCCAGSRSAALKIEFALKQLPRGEKISTLTQYAEHANI